MLAKKVLWFLVLVISVVVKRLKREIGDLLAERGIIVTRESIRLWCIKYAALYARRLKRKHRCCGDTFFIDEVFAGMPDQQINGKQHRDLSTSAFYEWSRAAA